MTEPTITCPCSTEIKLTASLAAPLIRATREVYEAKIAQKNAEVSKREAELKAHFAAVEQAMLPFSGSRIPRAWMPFAPDQLPLVKSLGNPNSD